VGDSLKPGISQDAGDQPDVGLLRRVEPEHRERLPERARGEVRKPDAQYKPLGIPVEFLLEDLPQAISARYFASVVATCEAVRVLLFVGFSRALLVPGVQSLHQQALAAGLPVGDRVDV